MGSERSIGRSMEGCGGEREDESRAERGAAGDRQHFGSRASQDLVVLDGGEVMKSGDVRLHRDGVGLSHLLPERDGVARNGQRKQ